MTSLPPALVLASASPRRADLLAQIGVTPTRVTSPNIDETPRYREIPRDYALRMAVEKVRTVAPSSGEIALSGDTVVALGRRILPRAENADEVAQCLALLSGRRHRVFSAVATIDSTGHVRSRISESIVIFAPLNTAAIHRYAAGGEGLGKAGGYAIQGTAAAFVRWMSGSYTGIVGLPLFETRALLIASGLIVAGTSIG